MSVICDGSVLLCCVRLMKLLYWKKKRFLVSSTKITEFVDFDNIYPESFLKYIALDVCLILVFT